MSNLTRRINFEDNKKCSINSKVYKNFTSKDYNFVEKFMKDNQVLDDSEFKGKANHLFINEKDRQEYPNHINIVEALMLSCSSK